MPAPLRPTSSLPVLRRLGPLRLAAFLLLGCTTFAADPTEPAASTIPEPSDGDLLPSLQLEPFVVNGDALAVSIHARNTRDRRYAERFANEVLRVAYDTLEDTHSPGRGLIIVGHTGEPHPLWVYRKFVLMAEAGQLQPATAALLPDLQQALKKWEEGIAVKANNEDLGLELDAIIPVLPFPLDGLGSRLYQVAWMEAFDVARVEFAFHALTPADLATDRLERFHWVYYLPPQDALDRVLKVALPKIMEQEDMGFFTRVAVRGAVTVFKPAIRKAMEGIRKGMLYSTILRARTDWSQDDINDLTQAYAGAIMPDFKLNDGRDATHARVMAAVEEQKQRNAEIARDPFVSPSRLPVYERTHYAAFLGDYTDHGQTEVTHRFVATADGFAWNYRDQPARAFHPAGPRLLVNDDGTMTLEFLVDETTGRVTGAEERWKRRRKTVPRTETHPTPPSAES